MLGSQHDELTSIVKLHVLSSTSYNRRLPKEEKYASCIKHILVADVKDHVKSINMVKSM